MTLYRYLGTYSDPPAPGTPVALADTLADDDHADDETVLGHVDAPTLRETADALADPPPAPGVIVQWDHGLRGFEYLEDLAVAEPVAGRGRPRNPPPPPVPPVPVGGRTRRGRYH